ncbi:MAG TPA: S8 family serine peptidase, partial [Verrucomicrobiae bacterium]|nr:S8 family serine peptidase [Verrucomicrobiae bacterium]
TSGFHYGLGVCPFVKLGSSVIFDNQDNDLFPTLYNLAADAYDGGARVSNNSWGGSSAGVYDSNSQTYDYLVRDAEQVYSSHPTAGNQEMVFVFAAGNDGPTAQTVGSPATAKNVISVGAADNVQPFPNGGIDKSGIGDTESSSANEIASFSSRGPCTDGRHKPDLVAPGTHVSGGVVQALNPGPTGTADFCFDGSGVSGGPDTNIFYPAAQQFYTASSGTSHSTPCVAGGCALLWQFFLNFYGHTPSPAMTKAYLMNSARYLPGTTANDTLWSDNQGMGEMNLGMAFDGLPRILRDEATTDLFTATGQTRSYTGVVSDSSKPFRVTLAWTDAAGNTTGAAYNNDLDLTVTVNGNTYKGNVFSGAYSATGGSADAVNNVESVFLPAGVSGSFVVTVTAANINSDGVPGNATFTDQDFALVVYNAQATGGASIILGTPSLIGESNIPTNGIVDPGETVTFSIPLQNGGGKDSTNLVATLLATNGVFAPSGPQNYGTLTAGGSAVSRPFTFTAAVACGGTVTATLQLQDATTNYGTVSFNIPVGQFVTVTNFAENFDGVLAPNLPAGWSSTATGDQSPWTVTETQRDGNSGKSVYVGVPPDASIAELVSPAVFISSSFAQVIFRNNYWLLSGTDGGVLEIQIGNGAFTDILVAGGAFVSGGYTMTLNTTSSNPLGGRQAWSGVSSGFITTTVSLPPAVAGQNIRLKWRCGTGIIQAGEGVGWYLDNVAVTDGGSYTCASAVSAPSLVNPQVIGGNLTFSIQTAGGHTYTLEYKNSLTDPTWTALQTFNGDGSLKTITNTLSAAPQRFYRVGVQ